MEKLDYSNCIAELKVSRNQAAEKARRFYEDIQSAETVSLSEKEKINKLRGLKSFKYFRKINQSFIKKIIKGKKISDRLFMEFYLPYRFDGMADEISYYKNVLDGEEKALTSIRPIRIDINDVVSNPKNFSFNDRGGSNIVDISRYLYTEHGKHDMNWYIDEIVRFWKDNNNSHFFTSTNLKKTGPRYSLLFNGSHILNTMQLLRNSGLSDSDLGLPNGFIESLKEVKFEAADNTTDDVEFILLFNSIHKLFTKYNITSEQFYIKDASERGKNVLGVKGKEISISNCEELFDYAVQVVEQSHERFSGDDFENDRTSQKSQPSASTKDTQEEDPTFGEV